MLGFQTPYKYLLKLCPNYNFLNIFGCECFPNPSPYNKYKFSFQTTQYLFNGIIHYTKATNAFIQGVVCKLIKMLNSMKTNFLLRIGFLLVQHIHLLFNLRFLIHWFFSHQKWSFIILQHLIHHAQ